MWTSGSQANAQKDWLGPGGSTGGQETARNQSSREEGGLLELRLPSFARVLPADEPDEVLHPGAGHGHHRHWQQSVLARVQGEVDINLLGRCCAYVTLWTEHRREGKAHSSGHTDPTGPRRLPSRTCVLILWAQTNLGAWGGPEGETFIVLRVYFFFFLIRIFCRSNGSSSTSSKLNEHYN